MPEQPDLPLPMTRRELRRRGWDRLDVLLVTGDAHVDHPAFGAALLGRWLVSHGLRVGVASQPRPDRPADLQRMGRPRLLAGVTAGAVDSMLAHYTAQRRKRRADAYTPGGQAGARPNRAGIVYTGLAHRAFPGLPVVLGGIEASMRRVSHYDFWSDRLRRSLLLEAKAELILYGMAERSLLELCRRLERAAGDPAAEIDLRQPGSPARAAIRGLPGSVQRGEEDRLPADAELLRLPSHEQIEADPGLLVQATLTLERQVHGGQAWALQQAGDQTLVLAPPAAPLSTAELDALYALPFSRRAHPSHAERVPAEQMIRFSITSHRGCGGGCAFCSLALHQGREIRSRSESSLRQEALALTRHPEWRGSISDVGGPSANLWGARCTVGAAGCARVSCLHPDTCPNLRLAQGRLADLLRSIQQLPGVKHLRVASGVRHDLALKEPRYLRALVGELTGGQLKLAPEHSSERVLRLMRKPSFALFERFLEQFSRLSRRAGRRQYVVPYLLSALPGSTDEQMRSLARWLKKRGWRPQQVQCFVPTPGTLASAMFYAGVDARGRPIHVARSDAQRARQHRILQSAMNPARPAAARPGR